MLTFSKRLARFDDYFKEKVMTLINKYLIGVLVFFSHGFVVAQQAPTAWGWPQPYDKVSPQSIELLKTKGWWPLTIAWQPSFSGQNATVVAMIQNELLAKRGLEVKLEPKAAGGLVNKAVVEGSAQMGAGGNFPLTLLVDQAAPIRVVAITAPNLKHQVIVPNSSAIQKMADFKGAASPITIGIVLGSSAEFYFQASAAANGVKIGKDVVLKNMSLAEQTKMPAGVGAIVPWDPVSTLVTTELKTGRPIDVSYPYNVYQGSFFVRSELVTQAPDVVQAITEAIVEADLWIRLNPEPAAAAMAARPEMKDLPASLLLAQIKEYNLLYKPSYAYPLDRFWGGQNQDIAMWLHLQGKIKKPLQRDDYRVFFVTQPMDKVFAKLGWKVPIVPPYIPADWSLKPRSTKLPEYDIVTNMKKPQPWPERSDLTKQFRFADKVYSP
jgi:ABC-type nitrate/sulfonate/bicarbonate transport system substrate-binding protein